MATNAKYKSDEWYEPVATYLFDITMSTGITLNTQGAVTPIVQVSYR